MDSTSEEKLEDPKFFLASTANYMQVAEGVIQERYYDMDTAPFLAMSEMRDKASEQLKDKSPAEEANLNDRNPEEVLTGKRDQKVNEPVDINQESEEGEGFYKMAQKKQEARHLEHGTFFSENGKIYYGNAEKREPVSYSNWYAGNTDPEEMKKHKELLDRQHFSGPFWENREMPKSVLDETFEQYLTGIEDEIPEAHPKDLNMKNKEIDGFEKVKR